MTEGEDQGAAPIEDSPAPEAEPEPEAAPPPGVVDPAGLGALVAAAPVEQLQVVRTALGIATALLEPGEQVHALVLGAYHSRPAVGLLTSDRVLLVNDHAWVPDRRSIPITADLVVKGLQDDRAASLTFITEGVAVTIAEILDRPSAHDLAGQVRRRVESLPAAEPDG